MVLKFISAFYITGLLLIFIKSSLGYSYDDLVAVVTETINQLEMFSPQIMDANIFENFTVIFAVDDPCCMYI